MIDGLMGNPNFPVDLKNCHEEPIQIPGAIQRFGVLIGFASDKTIVVASENAVEFLPEIKGFESRPVGIDEVVLIDDSSKFLGHSNEPGKRLVQISKVSDPTRSYFGAIFTHEQLQILEIETITVRETNATTSYLADMPRMMKDIRSAQSLQDLADFAVKKIREITGFDRVMVYEFDRDYNGEVIAEAKTEELESLKSQHFPASDIPTQARELYCRNWIRIIPNIDYSPSRLFPSNFRNIDLSDSSLRSVSPIHIQYLRNMGVKASMSISLVVDGKLWGLIACHHYSSEHLVGLNVRFGCEAYGQLISWHIKTLTASERLKAVNVGEERLHKVLKSFSENSDFRSATIASQEDLLELFGASGIVIRLGNESVKIGTDAGEIFNQAISSTLANRSILEPFVSNEIGRDPQLSEIPHNQLVAGLMGLALSPIPDYYIACLRPEVQQTIHWAGKPEKEKIDVFDPAQRLVPRGSFQLWTEIHQGKCKDWSEETIDLLKRFGLLFVKIVIERNALVEKSNQELKALNQAKDEFVAMVSHELRTPLNAIIGWTELALSGELDIEKYSDAFKIVQRNARSQNQLISDLLDVSRIISGKMKLSVKNMRVSEVAEAVILSFAPATEAKEIQVISHLEQDADTIIGDPGRIQQIFWNLMSNAIKFSPKKSKIWVSVRRYNSQVEFEVKDTGIGIEACELEKIFGRFHQVDSSTSRRSGGLGLGLAISKHIVELHGGKIEAKSEGLAQGTVIRAIFPIGPVIPEEKDNHLPIDDQFSTDVSKNSHRLKGEVILIVEDEKDASRFLELLIRANGAKTFVAHDGNHGLEVLSKYCAEIGIVLSDVGMPGMDGFEFVGKIRSSPDKRINSLCAVALTAFARPQDRIAALKAGFDSYIAKPVMQEELLTVLESACKAKKAGRLR